MERALSYFAALAPASHFFRNAFLASPDNGLPSLPTALASQLLAGGFAASAFFAGSADLAGKSTGFAKFAGWP